MKQNLDHQLQHLVAGLSLMVVTANPRTAGSSARTVPPADLTGLLNDYLREQSPELSPRDIGGQMCEKIHVGYQPVLWFNLFAERRDRSTDSDKRTPGHRL